MNLIPEIAKMLCVEIDEEFKISQDGEILDNGTLYKFNSAWFFKHNNDTDDWDLCCDSTLIFLLNGQIDVVKLPFEPKSGEKYFYISTTHPLSVEYGSWSGSEHVIELTFKYCGNVFRTKAEAEAHKYEIYERLTGKKWNSGITVMEDERQ